MAVVRVAIQSCILEEGLFGCGSLRSESAKRLSKKLLEALCDDVKLNIFETFSSKLVALLNTATIAPSNVKTFRTKRERMWTAFHTLQLKKLPPLWDALFQDVNCNISESDEVALFTQHINEKVFEMAVLQRTSIKSTTSKVPPLTENEANALRYAAGYVPFALKTKLSDRPEFVSFLSTLAVSGEDSDYLAYTRKWIDRVDRGGLFRINDQSYAFFKDVEMITRKHLAQMFSLASTGQDSVMQRQDILDNIVNHPDVQFSWSIVCAPLDDEYMADELLKHVVDLWLTIRGFSEAGSWMEYYKQCKMECTKRVHGLRTSLKRKAEQIQSNKEN